jgi:hypothetical protein
LPGIGLNSQGIAARLKRQKQGAGIPVAIRHGLMQAIQASPADTFTGLSFFHSISHEIGHGTDVNRFGFTQLGDGRFVRKRD